METKTSLQYTYTLKKFKSYYVVWKLSCLFLSASNSILFKSYYVVWKLVIYNLDKETFEEFKSYYVVWKPPLGNTHIFFDFCLNRTM